MAKLSIEHIKGNTYFIPSPTNVGVYVENGSAVLIDSGNDKEAGRNILRLLTEQGWGLRLIINTHSNSDHIGGNAHLQEKTGCRIAATRMESAFINDPLLEPAFLYGGYPFKELRNKFLMAKPSTVTSVIENTGDIMDTGLRAIPLPGHFFDMIGIMTPDNIFFIADSLFPSNVISKYHLFFLWDIRSHLETLEKLKTFDAGLFVPSHGEPLRRVDELVELNKKKIYEIQSEILAICNKAVTTEEVLQEICSVYNVTLNPTQYVLVLSTIRSYLSFLYEEGSLECLFGDGKMTWKTKAGT